MIKNIYRHSPPKIKKILSYGYHLIFLSGGYLFKPFGFFLKTKLDLYKFLKIPYTSDIKVKNFIFSPFGYDLIAESFNEGLYMPLLNCKTILGLGGFVGDADIYLSQKCDKIYSFEPEKFKFEIMKENIRKNKLEKKIFPYNFAVVNSNQKRMTIKKESEMDVGSSVTHLNNYKAKIGEEISCMHIKDALKLDLFDGLKCDIEGAEWGIIEYFLKKGWNFNKGVFELHFSKTDFKKELALLNTFISFLDDRGYKTYFYYNLRDLKYKKSLNDFNLNIEDINKPWKTIIMLVEN